MKRWLWFLLKYFYYTREGEPVKCKYCGSKKLNHVTKAIVAEVAAEIVINCRTCDEEVGYWAYGYYDPGYRERER
jgi:DNA-directed RNA polymerase subunit RPC12/RpoP